MNSICEYCHHDVDTDEQGYLFIWSDQLVKVYYHSECFEFAEGVPVA